MVLSWVVGTDCRRVLLVIIVNISCRLLHENGGSRHDFALFVVEELEGYFGLVLTRSGQFSSIGLDQ